MESENTPGEDNSSFGSTQPNVGPEPVTPNSVSPKSDSRKRFSIFLSIVVPGLALVLVFSAYFAYLTVSLPDVDELTSQNPGETSLMRQRAEEAAAGGQSYHPKRQWLPMKEISKIAVVAVLVGEDANFYGHNGFDFHEIREAVKSAADGKRLRGASTITQQLAKNLYLSTERSFDRKLREAMLTRRLEATLSKRRILELYLNVIEWGDGIYGIEAASRHYFGKSASRLSPRESAELAARIPSPRNASDKFVSRGTERILGWMVRAGHLSAAEAALSR